MTDWLTIGVVILSAAGGCAPTTLAGWLLCRRERLRAVRECEDYSLAAWTSSIVAGDHAATARGAAKVSRCHMEAVKARCLKGGG